MKEVVLIEENKNLIRLKTCDFNTIEEEKDYIIKNEEFLDNEEKEKIKNYYDALNKKTECIIL